MREMIMRLVREEDGQGLTEYALIIAVVSILIVGALVSFRTGLVEVFSDIISEMKNPGTGT